MQYPILVKLKMKKSYKSALAINGLVILCFMVVGILYLFYDKVLTTDDIEVDGMISINYVDGKEFDIENTKNYKFSVSNNGDKVNYYNINFVKIRGEGTYKILYNDKIIMEGDLNSIDEFSTDEISIDAQETKIYTIEITNTGENNLKGSINIRVKDSKIVTFADTILNNNKINEPFSEIGDAALENEGLIKDSDDIGVTYYFRGNVNNNYVTFANLNWRIVRINGDGTVRLILDDVAETLTNYYQEANEETKNLNFQDSNMNAYLKTWFNENIASYESFISNNLFCNDMNIKDDVYESYTRIYTNNIPTFYCLADAFKSNIGTLTIDEVILAGASTKNENKDFYLYNSKITEMWYTMSGAKSADNNVNLFMVDTNGKIRYDVNGNLYRNVRPVINIIKNIEVKGEGTQENPYVIE